jgi:hypothetical protein
MEEEQQRLVADFFLAVLVLDWGSNEAKLLSSMSTWPTLLFLKAAEVLAIDRLVPQCLLAALGPPKTFKAKDNARMGMGVSPPLECICLIPLPCKEDDRGGDGENCGEVWRLDLDQAPWMLGEDMVALPPGMQGQHTLSMVLMAM